MKLLNISELDAQGTKNNKPIWGINTAPSSDIQHEGEILLQISSPNSATPDLLRVPQTWLPIELTRDITRRRLLESSEFRRAVSSELIGLISEEQARMMLNQSGAVEEQKRLVELRKQVRAAGSARTIADGKAEIARADGVRDDDDKPNGRNRTTVISYGDDDEGKPGVTQTAVEDIEPGIKPNFKMWVDKMNNKADDVATKNEIRSRHSFTTPELRYLSRNLAHHMEASLRLVNKTLAKTETLGS